MGQEIERKFLVTDCSWREQGEGRLYRQGYLPTRDHRTVRVRVVDQQGYLTLKGPTQGLTRSEFEYAIPASDAVVMLETLCEPPLIEKRRYCLKVGDHQWEIDEFLGDNAGLVLAEIELSSETEAFQRPPWLGTEVSHDPRYYNANLVRHPYKTWSESGLSD